MFRTGPLPSPFNRYCGAAVWPRQSHHNCEGGLLICTPFGPRAPVKRGRTARRGETACGADAGVAKKWLAMAVHSLCDSPLGLSSGPATPRLRQLACAAQGSMVKRARSPGQPATCAWPCLAVSPKSPFWQRMAWRQLPVGQVGAWPCSWFMRCSSSPTLAIVFAGPLDTMRVTYLYC